MKKLFLGAFAASAIALSGCSVHFASDSPDIPAAPSDPDSAYLKTLSDNSITNPTEGPQGLIQAAHQVCVEREKGKSEQQVIDEAGSGTTRLSYDSIKLVVQTAEADYCPQYLVDKAAHPSQNKSA